jgi:hypothetical protein
MGTVKKRAVLIPLKARSIHNSFFLMGDDGDPPSYMPRVSINLVEWPNVLVIYELLDNTLVLADLPDGVTLELVRIPGNRSPGNYQVGSPLMRFENCVVMRKFVRNVDMLELGLVVDCMITIL